MSSERFGEEEDAMIDDDEDEEEEGGCDEERLGMLEKREGKGEDRREEGKSEDGEDRDLIEKEIQTSRALIFSARLRLLLPRRLKSGVPTCFWRKLNRATYLLPSFLHLKSRVNHDSRVPPVSQSRPTASSFPPDTGNDIATTSSSPVLFQHQSKTAYLSGLRGFASVVVFIFHFAHGSYPGMDYAYGDTNNDNENNESILQLPFIRIFYAAEAMVALFFVISGYVLSQRCVAHVRRGQVGEAFATVSSLTFRRGIRLYLPALVSSFISYITQRGGWMPIKGLPKGYVSNFKGDSRLYIGYVGRLLGVWKWDVELDVGWWYNPQLWTVPVEFRSSMVLFLLISATGRCRTWVRLVVDTGVVVQCMLVFRWDVALFVSGKIIAELQAVYDQERHNEQIRRYQLLPGRNTNRNNRRILRNHHLWSIAWTISLTLIFLIGLYLAGYPASPPQNAPFYSSFSALVRHNKNGRRIYYALAAMQILGALVFLPVLQKPFNSLLARYFGQISYALYLVHGTLIRVLGGRILKWTGEIVGKRIEDEWWAFNVGFGLASILFLPVVVWMADLFERMVDRRSMMFAKWVEERVRAENVSY